MRLLPLTLLLVAGCAEKDGDEPPLPATGELGDDTAMSCEGAPPEIVSFSIENGGLHDFSDLLDCATGEDCTWPAVDLVIRATDADADLDQYVIEIWYDGIVDGAVSDSAAPIDLIGAAGDACEVGDETWHTLLAVGTGGLETETEYEFAAVITDAAGLSSDAAIASGYTPAADGSDGGAR